VVQVYLRELLSRLHQPRQQLCGFQRLSVPSRGIATGEIEIPVRCFRHWDADKLDYVVTPGKYELRVGTASDTISFEREVEIN
jgi:beta-glucosidase